jgi:pimeloyl-ACP methyl ester carboxylesterase
MRKVISKDGTAIAFDQSGRGPVVILVGGALGDRSASDPLAALLAQHFTVLNYDRRGRGDSSDTPPYGLEREIEDLGALIKEGGESAFVLGGSSGAVLALEAAAHGLAITKLALYEPPFIVDESRPPLPRDYVTQLNEMVASGQRGDAVAFFMTRAVGMPAEAIAPMRRAPFWPSLEAAAHTLAYDGTIMGDTMSGHPLPRGKWASVTVPTLVMDGGASPAWMRNAVQALVDALPCARRCTLEGQTHVVAPEVLAPVLIEFFNG